MQVIAIAVPEVLGALVSASTAKNITWYQTLAKPSWAPPTWAFGQVHPSYIYGCMPHLSLRELLQVYSCAPACVRT